MASSKDSRRDRYELISDSKKEILIKYYELGMTGTGKEFATLISQACEESGFNKTKVQVGKTYSISTWCFNMNREI